jgi:hypothetical protein
MPDTDGQEIRIRMSGNPEIPNLKDSGRIRADGKGIP